MSEQALPRLRLKWLGIDTYREPIVYIRADSPICRSEGFLVNARVEVSACGCRLVATLQMIHSDLLDHHEVSLSQYAWELMRVEAGEMLTLSHAPTLESVNFIRSKLYGNPLESHQTQLIVEDIAQGKLSDIHLTMFLSSMVGSHLSRREIIDLTEAMISSGRRLAWPSDLIVDKHCVGGLPGNRTTPIIVAIVAAFGLMIPKTSSRAITSPAGTADTMEVFTPVNLSLDAMRAVVEKENGCVTWGGSITLSPVDDLLIRIERVMGIDSEGQMVASILSKKVSAGSSHIVIDMPVGSTAKVRSMHQAEALKSLLEAVATAFSVKLEVMITDGSEPIGRGIGPALEAKDILAVLTNDANLPIDLKEKALVLAARLIEFAPHVKPGQGMQHATEILESGRAFKKFEAICRAQGGYYDIPEAYYSQEIEAPAAGKIVSINNRELAQLAKLAGAPREKAAGVSLAVKANQMVEKGQPLFTLYAENKSELEYALSYFNQHPIFKIQS